MDHSSAQAGQQGGIYSAPGSTSPAPRSRAFSLRSDKSGGSKPKEDLTESPKDKQRRDSIWKGSSKANPNAAINEAQPGVNAILEQNTLISLRGVQHKDAFGNVITDPDLSNPTRPRMERPLDTIRAFEKAIDNRYKRRSNYGTSDSPDQPTQFNGSRRNSAYGGFDGGPSPNRYSNGGNGGGYYGGQRTDNFAPSPSGPPRRFPNQRMASDPNMLTGQRPYPPQHGHQFSQDTMNTGMSNGSDSTGPWANSTDPSSENSSIDRVQTASNGYGQNSHGPNGYQSPIPEDGAYPMKGGAPPVQALNGPRRPIPLGNSGDVPNTPLPSTKRPEQEKRKSWMKRRFSKKE